MNEKTLALVGLGAVGLFVVSRVVQANGAGFPHGVASPVPASSPSLLDTLVADAKKGIAVEGIVAGSLTKLGIIGGAVAAPAVVAPVATIGIDAATAAALPGATAIEAAPGALETAASGALETGGESAGLGIAGTIAVASIPLAVFALMTYLFPGNCRARTPAEETAFANAYAKCGGAMQGVTSTPGVVAPGNVTWTNADLKGLQWLLPAYINRIRGMSPADRDAMIRAIGRSPGQIDYLNRLWCWRNDPDGWAFLTSYSC